MNTQEVFTVKQYTALGDKEISKEYKKVFKEIAHTGAINGQILRTNRNIGAAEAFFDGCFEGKGSYYRFLPWDNFGASKVKETKLSPEAYVIASKFVVNWAKMNEYGRKYYASLVELVLIIEKDYITPIDLAIVYDKDKSQDIRFIRSLCDHYSVRIIDVTDYTPNELKHVVEGIFCCSRSEVC